MGLTWTQHDPRSLLAQQMRRDIRARRRSGPAGHRFIYKDLHILAAAEYHVILTHFDDQVWQHWAYHPEKGWVPLGAYPDREDALAAAEFHEWEVEYPALPLDPGIYVLAGWPNGNGEVLSYTMRVPCRTKNTAIAVADSLRNLGMVTKYDEVPRD